MTVVEVASLSAVIRTPESVARTAKSCLVAKVTRSSRAAHGPIHYANWLPQSRRCGPACHAAVVALAMGKPAVVGIADLDVGVEAVCAAGRTVPEGTLVAIDGTGGEVVLGAARITAAAADPSLHRLLAWADEVSGDTSEHTETERLGAAHAVLRQRSGSCS